MSGSQTAVQPRPARALTRLPACFWILFHLLLNQPLVTLRDTSPENLGNQGHTGRKPPSQPSNPAGHLAADWARSAGQQRGTSQPQNPQPGLGALQGACSLAPGTSLDSHYSPQKAQPSRGVAGVQGSPEAGEKPRRKTRRTSTRRVLRASQRQTHGTPTAPHSTS